MRLHLELKMWFFAWIEGKNSTWQVSGIMDWRFWLKGRRTRSQSAQCGPVSLVARVWFSDTGISLNIACLGSLSTGTTSKGSTRARVLGTDARFWRGFCQLPLYFPMLPWNTLNKMAGTKLTNEETIVPWAPRSLNNVLLSSWAQGPSTGT